MSQKRQTLRPSQPPTSSPRPTTTRHHHLHHRRRVRARSRPDNNSAFRYRMRRPGRGFGRTHKERLRARRRGVLRSGAGYRSVANPQRARFGLQACLGQRVTATTGLWQRWHSTHHRVCRAARAGRRVFHASLAPVVSLACCRARTQEPRRGMQQQMQQWHGGRGLRSPASITDAIRPQA